MHADLQSLVRRYHDGVIPPGWTASASTDYQKAKVIAATAWHNIKDDGDPELYNCDLSHQERCTGVVESLMLGNTPDSTPFAIEAHRLWMEVADLNQ